MNENSFAHDQLLEELIKEIVDKGVELPITLSVQGLVVTGKAITVAAYLRESAKIMQRGYGDFNKAFANAFANVAKSLEADNPPHEQETVEDEQNETDKNESESRLRYIYLKEAVIYQETRINVGVWRGRLDRVDGFSFGILE